MELSNQTPAVCKACGKVLAPEEAFCTGCGHPVNKTKSIPIVTIVKIAIAVVLVIVALVMVIKGNEQLSSYLLTSMRSSRMECIENRRECQNLLQSAPGMFAADYREIIRQYDGLIADYDARIAKIEKEAMVKFIIAGVSVVAAVAVIVIPWKRRVQYGAC